MPIRVMLLALALLVSSSAVRDRGDRPDVPDPGLIDQLITELGDDHWRVREAASERLFEIGIEALPAIRQATLSSNLEIKARATTLVRMITDQSGVLLLRLRGRLQARFHEADYEAAINISHTLTDHDLAAMIDWLWQGHACQRAGRWREAVDAYRQVVALIDEDIHAVPKPNAAPLADHDREQLVTQRSALMLWIARMQDVELQDAKAATATLGEALDFLAASRTPVNHHWCSIAKTYARYLLRAGEPAKAIEAWKQYVTLLQQKGGDLRDRTLVDVEHLFAALSALPRDEPRPTVPWIIHLDDTEPVTLNVPDQAVRARAYRTGQNDYYAFAPPPGMEFVSFAFACDIKQFKPRFGGQFGCSVIADEPPRSAKALGVIEWGSVDGGRAVVQRTFPVPPGARLVHVRIGQVAEAFTVHRVTATATLRPATEHAPPVEAGAWMQADLRPTDGALSFGDRTLLHQHALTNVTPGDFTLRFTAPGRRETIEIPFRVLAGRHYGLFFNLDSPLAKRQTNLIVGRGVNTPRLSIQRLAERDYIAIWSDGQQILSARSENMHRWSAVQSLPLNSVFANIEPSTWQAPDGTIHLAYFSNRLGLQAPRTNGYRLWMTSTRDGESWTAPRLIQLAGPSDGPPQSTPWMLAGPRGKQWLFWRDQAACGDTMDDIVELTRLELPVQAANPMPIQPWNIHVVVDGDDRFHMLCDDMGSAIYHLTSPDGRTWTPPREVLVDKESAHWPSNPQLILHGDNTFVLDARGHLYPVDLSQTPIAVREPTMIASWLEPLTGRFHREQDELFQIVGTETTWLVHGQLADLVTAKSIR